MAWTVDIVMNLAGGALVSLFGLAVLFVKPRTRTAIWFALFAMSFGAQFIISNMRTGLDASETAWWFIGGRVFVRILFVTSALGLAVGFPRPLGGNDRKAVVLAGSCAGLGLVVNLIATAGRDPWTNGVFSGLAFFAFWAMIAALYFLLFLFAGRYAADPGNGNERSQYILMSVALLFYAGLVAGAGSDYDIGESVLSNDITDALRGAINILLMMALSVYWLVNTRHATSGAARNLALFALIMPLIGMVHVLYIPDYGLFGLVRILMVATLAYAVVRHRLLGIDVKVRWTISKTTLAGTFVAVFFIASEAAQEFFGAALENNYVGIVAAGLLVFAIAPLSRFADHVAARAVPVTHPIGQTAADEAYRDALRIAMRDRHLDADEEVRLAALAEQLGIGAARATQILHDVKQEAQGRVG